MIKIYSLKRLVWIGLVYGAMTGCHQEPVVPTSAIPLTCQIAQVVNVVESSRDTTRYKYDDFGHVVNCTYRKWVDRRLVLAVDQTFTFSNEHYLTARTDKTTAYTTGGSRTEETKNYSYLYEGSPKLIQQIQITDASGRRLGSNKYGYDTGKLQTYTEENGSGSMLKRYTFDGAGKLTQLEEPGSDVVVTVTNGKITKRAFKDGAVVTYEFDNRGQLTSQVITAGLNRFVHSYAFDTKPYWTATQLQWRGIPTLDLGEHVQLNNNVAYSYQTYQDGKQTGRQEMRYKHTYNQNGYSLGYGRSDGARQAIYYSFCP